MEKKRKKISRKGRQGKKGKNKEGSKMEEKGKEWVCDILPP